MNTCFFLTPRNDKISVREKIVGKFHHLEVSVDSLGSYRGFTTLSPLVTICSIRCKLARLSLANIFSLPWHSLHGGSWLGNPTLWRKDAHCNGPYGSSREKLLYFTRYRAFYLLQRASNTGGLISNLASANNSLPLCLSLSPKGLVPLMALHHVSDLLYFITMYKAELRCHDIRPSSSQDPLLVTCRTTGKYSLSLRAETGGKNLYILCNYLSR